MPVPLKKDTPAQFEVDDGDEIKVTCAYGARLRVPEAYVCTIAMTSPQGDHKKDRKSKMGGNYLVWHQIWHATRRGGHYILRLSESETCDYCGRKLPRFDVEQESVKKHGKTLPEGEYGDG